VYQSHERGIHIVIQGGGNSPLGSGFSVGFESSRLVTNITLLRSYEVDEIYEGNDDRYKAVTATPAEPATPR
jgi:hypothetical protein